MREDKLQKHWLDAFSYLVELCKIKSNETTIVLTETISRQVNINLVEEICELIDKKTGVPQTHTIRYWETQFKQLKPTIKAGGRRYYSEKNIKMLNFVKLLLKEKGLKIAGVKKILNVKADQSIDEHEYFDINTSKNKSTKFMQIC